MAWEAGFLSLSSPYEISVGQTGTVAVLSPVSIILQILHKHAHFNTAVIRRTSGRRLINFSKKKKAISEIRGEWNEN